MQDELKNPEQPEISLLDKALHELCFYISNTMDKKIKAALEKHGYVFETDQELLDFSDKRIKIEYHQNKLRRLKVDNVVILEYWDTMRVKEEGEKWTITWGEIPSKILTKREGRIAEYDIENMKNQF